MCHGDDVSINPMPNCLSYPGNPEKAYFQNSPSFHKKDAFLERGQRDRGTGIPDIRKVKREKELEGEGQTDKEGKNLKQAPCPAKSLMWRLIS